MGARRRGASAHARERRRAVFEHGDALEQPRKREKEIPACPQAACGIRARRAALEQPGTHPWQAASERTRFYKTICIVIEVQPESIKSASENEEESVFDRVPRSASEPGAQQGPPRLARKSSASLTRLGCSFSLARASRPPRASLLPASLSVQAQAREARHLIALFLPCSGRQARPPCCGSLQVVRTARRLGSARQDGSSGRLVRTPEPTPGRLPPTC
jgi:hypothetical protein